MTQYSVKIFDNYINEELKNDIWNYIQNQSYHATRKDLGYPLPGSIINYIPAENKKEYLSEEYPSVNNQYMHRCVFGNNEQDLAVKHPIIFELWKQINSIFYNKFHINGDLEGIADQKYKMARVYVNAQPNESIKRSHGIHRDTIDLNEERNFTLLYIANPVWYPTWMSENIFYEDDITTGDTQQFQKGHGQSRGFHVGYPYATVSPKPGRIILYDGRALHTTKPTSDWAQDMRYAVVFRIRSKV